jgi:prepilin-type N-terminal cleavage/methylation domain-containing protein
MMGEGEMKMFEGKNRKGFTLVEIIVVLVILAILAAFTIPAMLGFVEDARKSSILAEGHEVLTAFQTSFTEEYGGGFNDGGSTKYYLNGDKTTTAYYLINNWSFYTKEGDNGYNLNDSSNKIAKKMLNFINSDVNYYNKVDYMGKTLSEIKSNTIKGSNSAKFAMVVIYKSDGSIKDFYYYRNGYLWVMKDGQSSIYSATTDPKIKFPSYDAGTNKFDDALQ